MPIIIGQIFAGVLYTMIALMYVSIIILNLTGSEDALLRRFFRNRVFLEFGALSYFIYLTHIGFLLFFHWQFGIGGKTPIGLIWLAEISLALFTCILLAKLSQKYFEQPLIRFGHKFKYSEN